MIRCIVAILVVVTTSFVISPLSAMGAGPMRIVEPKVALQELTLPTLLKTADRAE